MDRPTFDVFVSYRHGEPDESWVRHVLVPALAAEDVTVFLDHDSFSLGAPVLTEMERAVAASARTLAVVSPRYLASRFTELENVLADTLGLEQGQDRLLVVVREPCEPPLRMRARLYLDMTRDDTFASDIARLVTAIRRPTSS